MLDDEFTKQEAAIIDGKPHLSATQISCFLRCPRQWYYRYVLGLRIPPSGKAAQSHAWHGAIEDSYNHVIQTGELPPESIVVDAFASRFDQEFKGEYTDPDGNILSMERPTLDSGESVGDLKDQGVNLTRLHRRELAPGVSPRLVEHKFSVSLGESFPYVLEGIIDLVETNDVIADNKALSRRPSQNDLDNSIQFSAYSLAYRISEKKREPALRMDLVVKTKEPKAARMLTHRTNGELRWFLGLVEEVAKQILAGIFPPNPTGWHCTPRFCGYYQRCRGGAAREDS